MNLRLQIFVLIGFIGIAVSKQTLAQRESYFFKSQVSAEFLPASEVLFFDDFRDGEIGKVPDNWEIHTLRNWHALDSSSEHAMLTMVNDHKALRVTDGGFEFLRPKIMPVICDTCYFTIEFDYLALDTDKVELHINYPYGTDFASACCAIDQRGVVNIGYLKSVDRNTAREHMENRYKEYRITGLYHPGTWHHFAAALKSKKMSLYIDRSAVFKNEYVNVKIEDIDFLDPYVITNLRIGQRSNLNSIDNIISTVRITTHLIRFEPNSPVLKRESYAYIKQLAEWLANNPTEKIEIDCFSDKGNSPDGLALNRAATVKELLLHYGAEGNRMSVKAGSGAVTNGLAGDEPSGNRYVVFLRK